MLRVSRLVVAGLVLGLGSASQAALVKFVIPMSGAQEVAPTVGDPDGAGTAFLTIDNATNPPTISCNIVANNIEPTISGAHIHQAAAGVNGSVVVNFSGQLSGSGLQDADLVNVLNNPAGFYVNVHTSPSHTGGAIRGQMNAPVPATGTYALVALAVLLLGAAVMVFKSRQPVLA